MRVGRRSLVVLAGMPGAGKSTVLARLRAPAGWPVLDSDQVRARLRHGPLGRLPYRWYRPLVHFAHRARILWCCAVSGAPVVAHEPATRRSTRALLALFGAATRRERVLVWLHAEPHEALAGQRARGRMIRERSFRRHVRRALRMHRRLLDGRPLRGWHRVHLLSRTQAGRGVRVAAHGELHPVRRGGGHGRGGDR
ncbi:AAA family ATPase [Saccharopolyspora sp. HNM0983]|uniref:AAA family ATPase n=1 Tax=Saccharopolyspora montiporae TaxID=2781240 RepID=A0A929BB12_9PSEU|nr:AAA family ATPase [Saccharopolyspora sp. HNM0983]MBE9374388.1 AAA family ATPase [Saccharopolyspora sp. HNM0983]